MHMCMRACALTSLTAACAAAGSMWVSGAGRRRRCPYRAVFECDVVNAPQNRATATEGGRADRAYLVVPDPRHVRLRRLHVSTDVAAAEGAAAEGAARRWRRRGCGCVSDACESSSRALWSAAAVVVCVTVLLALLAAYWARVPKA